MRYFLLAIVLSAGIFTNCCGQSAQKGSGFNIGVELSTLAGKAAIPMTMD